MRKTIVALVMGMAIFGTAACGPQVVDCSEQVCVNQNGNNGGYDNDREWGEEEEWDD